MKNKTLNNAKNSAKTLHREFVQLGRERNKITYKLLAMLPEICAEKVYEKEGYSNIYDYAARVAGLSSGVVLKALKLEKKLQNMPHLRKAIETQGVNKVGIVVGLATEENEKELAGKVKNMSKPALQEYSKELRGKFSVSWQVELDEEMMFMLLKLKKKYGKNLSNKECLRKLLEDVDEGSEQENMTKNRKGDLEKIHNFQPANPKIPGGFSQEKAEQNLQPKKTETRYVPVRKKRNLGQKCNHPGCYRPAEIIHHTDRFSETHNHEKLKPLCKQHHEFAHNGISEQMQPADHQYRKCRQVALV